MVMDMFQVEAILCVASLHIHFAEEAFDSSENVDEYVMIRMFFRCPF